MTSEDGPLTELIDRYLALIASATSEVGAIEAMLDPEFRFIEHSNLMSPGGSERDRATVLAAVPQGRALLSAQRFEVRDHTVAASRVITRALWEAQLAVMMGPLMAGTTLRADLAMFFEIREGRILRQENFDCYQPPQLG